MLSHKITILAVSYLFPNSIYKEFGIFVLHRLKAVSRHCRVIVINPVPWFPFCTKFKRYKNFNKIPEKEWIQGIEVYHPRFFIIPRYFKVVDYVSFALSVWWKSKKIQKHHAFDLIDLHWTYPDILAGKLLSILYKKKWLMTVRGVAALNMVFDSARNAFYEEKSVKQLILKKLLPHPDQIITLSSELKTLCMEHGVSKDKVTIIPNGINTSDFRYIDRKKARNRINIPHYVAMVFTVGNLIQIKGFDRVIRGLNYLKTRYPAIVYYIAGSPGAAGNFTTQLETLIHKEKLEGSVVFVGQVDHSELVYWFNAADIYCLASRTEGCPNALMEALACGCPCVATRVGMVSDMMKEPFMGELVQNNGHDVVRGIDTALSQKYDRKKIAGHMTQYSWENCAGMVVKEYQKLHAPHE